MPLSADDHFGRSHFIQTASDITLGWSKRMRWIGVDATVASPVPKLTLPNAGATRGMVSAQFAFVFVNMGSNPFKLVDPDPLGEFDKTIVPGKSLVVSTHVRGSGVLGYFFTEWDTIGASATEAKFPDEVVLDVEVPIISVDVATPATFDFFEKNPGGVAALDYMGVKVEAEFASQDVWAPGTGEAPSQEYPGGWVTPGNYDLSLIGANLHDLAARRIPGSLPRSGIVGSAGEGNHEIQYFIARAGDSPPAGDWGPNFIGWMSHSWHDYPGAAVPGGVGATDAWNNPAVHPNGSHTSGAYLDSIVLPTATGIDNTGSSYQVTLNAGDTLHVAFGKNFNHSDTVSNTGSDHFGTDGMTVHCVQTQPEPRHGLWGAGSASWSQTIWDKLVERINDAANYYVFRDTGTGEVDGFGPASHPNPFLSDTYNDQGNQTEHYFSRNGSRWLCNRGFNELVNPGTEDLVELRRLFDAWTNMGQFCFCWSDNNAIRYPMAHGQQRYQGTQGAYVMRILPAAVALGLDPSHEGLHRNLSWLAQKVDMTLTKDDMFAYDNAPFNDSNQLETSQSRYVRDHLEDPSGFTGADRGGESGTETSIKQTSSHRMSLWGPCLWARDLMFPGQPDTPGTVGMLNSYGWKDAQEGGDDQVDLEKIIDPRHARYKITQHGHGWTSGGGYVAPAQNNPKLQLDIQGIQWLWFAYDDHDGDEVIQRAKLDYMWDPAAPAPKAGGDGAFILGSDFVGTWDPNFLFSTSHGWTDTQNIDCYWRRWTYANPSSKP